MLNRRAFIGGILVLTGGGCSFTSRRDEPLSTVAATPKPLPRPGAERPALPLPAELGVDLNAIAKDRPGDGEVRAIFDRLYWEVSGEVLESTFRIQFLPKVEYVQRHGDDSAGLSYGAQDVELIGDRPLFSLLATLGHEVLGHAYHRRTFPAFEARETDATLSEVKGFAGELSMIHHLEDRYAAAWYRPPRTADNLRVLPRILDQHEQATDMRGSSNLKWYSRSLVSLWVEVARDPALRAVVEEHGRLTAEAAWSLNQRLGTRLGKRYWDETGLWTQDEKAFVLNALQARLQPVDSPASPKGLVPVSAWEFLLP